MSTGEAGASMRIMRIGASAQEETDKGLPLPKSCPQHSQAWDKLSVLRRFDKRAEALASRTDRVPIQQEETASLRNLEPGRKIQVCLNRDDAGCVRTMW